MKLLLTFLTIVLFSFGANGKINMDKSSCVKLSSRASDSYFNFTFYTNMRSNASSEKKINKYDNFSKNFLDRAYKLAILYQTFCQD